MTTSPRHHKTFPTQTDVTGDTRSGATYTYICVYIYIYVYLYIYIYIPDVAGFFYCALTQSAASVDFCLQKLMHI